MHLSWIAIAISLGVPLPPRAPVGYGPFHLVMCENTHFTMPTLILDDVFFVHFLIGNKNSGLVFFGNLHRGLSDN